MNNQSLKDLQKSKISFIGDLMKKILKSEKQNLEILKITMTIQEKYPELSKYLDEMPVTIPNENDPEINNMNLKAYNDSLISLLHNYIDEHTQDGVN